jgi:nitrogen-specific signal transduction histidine kinase
MMMMKILQLFFSNIFNSSYLPFSAASLCRELLLKLVSYAMRDLSLLRQQQQQQHSLGKASNGGRI